MLFVLLVSSMVQYYVRAVLKISNIPWVLRFLRNFFLEHLRAINQYPRFVLQGMQLWQGGSSEGSC